MLHVFKGEILANMTQVSDVAPGPLVIEFPSKLILLVKTKMYSKKVFDKHSMTQKGVNIQK
jgi:hypothetical protein